MENTYLHQTKQAGFTLIEMLVVVSVIAILTALITTAVFQARIESREMSRVTDLEQLKLGLKLYKEAHGDYPGIEDGVAVDYEDGVEIGVGNTIDAELAPFLSQVKADPMAEPGGGGAYGYWYASDLLCRGSGRVAIMAKSTEKEKFANFAEKCDSEQGEFARVELVN